MKLFLCEKPSQGNDIGKVLGAMKRGEGCLFNTDGSICVTWAIGHLVEQFSPEMYQEAWKKWSLDTLPILPNQWQVAPKKTTRKQYNAVMKLLKQAREVVIATDIDREGEMIARELLTLAKFKGRISRLWLSALDEASIRKGLQQLKSNEATINLYYAGLARSRADWLVGMNFSRLFTLLSQQKGYQGVMSVGRVQSPTLNLVVERDHTIKHFISQEHFRLSIQVANSQGNLFWAGLVMPENLLNEDGLCLKRAVLDAVSQEVRGQGRVIVKSVNTKREKENPPLPFNLSTLQSDCNRLFGYGAAEVLSIAQALYETHKATTYPRSDCSYLPTEQFAEAPKVIEAVLNSDHALSGLRSKLNLQQKSRAWNDKKITAHHAIIPTMKKVDIGKMNEKEFKVYDLIRRHYLAQFLPFAESDKTEIKLQCNQFQFVAKGNVPVNLGWKILFPKKSREAESVDEESQGLPKVSANESCELRDTQIKKLMTSPPSHFTEGTLLTAMVNAARFVKDPRLKQKLRETEGLGTEATRAALIQNLLERNYITKKGKYIISTPAGQAIVANLPDVLKDPGMTALWEQALNQIAEGTLTLDVFMQKQESFIKMLLQNMLKQGVNISHISTKKCPKCGKIMVKRKSKTGQFWGCSGYPDCQFLENIGNRKITKK